MKTIFNFLSVLAASAVVTAAQQNPKLAIAGVEATPTLTQKHHPEPPANVAPISVNNTSSGPADFKGTWKGAWRVRGRQSQLVLTIQKSQNGSIEAGLQNVTTRRSWQSTSAACNGNHVTLSFNESRGVNGGVWEGDVDAASGKMSAQWKRGKHVFPVEVFRSDMLAKSASQSASFVPSSLEEIIHLLDMQLVDRFSSAHLFTVVEDDDLKKMISPPEGQSDESYNLKDSKTADQFKLAGIRYLLVTTLENFGEENLDLGQGTLQYRGGTGNHRYWRSPNGGGSAGSGLVTQGQFDPHVKKDQRIRLTIRSRLFDAGTGDLLDSDNHSFTTNRSYAVVAQGNNTRSASDLGEIGARSLADWAVSRAREAVFPKHASDKGALTIK